MDLTPPSNQNNNQNMLVLSHKIEIVIIVVLLWGNSGANMMSNILAFQNIAKIAFNTELNTQCYPIPGK